jgi:hypothetical protein
MYSLFHIFPWLFFLRKTEKLPDHSFSFTLQNQIIRFTSEGDLLDIQLSHKHYDVVKVDKTFHNQTGIPLIKMKLGMICFQTAVSDHHHTKCTGPR